MCPETKNEVFEFSFLVPLLDILENNTNVEFTLELVGTNSVQCCWFPVLSFVLICLFPHAEYLRSHCNMLNASAVIRILMLSDKLESILLFSMHVCLPPIAH